MDKLVTLTLTDSECLNMRFALNAHAMHWGDQATEARKAGNRVEADTCERIRSDYHRLWDMVNDAQEARGRVKDWTYRRAAPPATCCQFHMSGGERTLSCGGDFAPASDIDQWGAAMGIAAAGLADEAAPQSDILQQIADTAF
jgi:hypothetical protein